MNDNLLPFEVALLLTAMVTAALAVFALRRRATPGAGWFALFVSAGVVWLVAYAMELASSDQAGRLFWNKAAYFGIAPIHSAWLLFALAYTGRNRWLPGRRRVLLFVVPAITIALAVTNEAHGLIWATYRLATDGAIPVLVLTHGWWFWLHAAHAYALYLFGLFLLIRHLARASALYRGQAVGLVVGTVCPFAANVAYLSGLRPGPGLDPTPFAFTISSLAFAWAIFRKRMLEIVPLAHNVVIHGMDDPVLVIDALGRVVDLNPAAERITGRSAADAIGHPASWVLATRPDLVERYRHVTEARDEVVLGSGANARLFDLRISPLIGQGGRTSGRVVVLRDVTSRQRAEDERLRRVQEEAARAAAEESVRLRDEILATVSHDLKNPLTTILGQAALLGRRARQLGGAQAEEVAAGLLRIERSSHRMGRMVDELLELAQLRAGEAQELRREPVDLVGLARSLVAEHQQTTDRHQIRLITEEARIIGQWDAFGLERALGNLLSNAIKYSPSGGEIHVSIARGDSAQGPGCTVIVRDHGVGIPAEELSRVFEPFHRGANVTGRFGGMGIGLAALRQIIERHGGSIDLESQEGIGTTVTVHLPLAADPASDKEGARTGAS